MQVRPNANLTERFRALLDRRDLREHVFQEFFEKNPEFLISPFLLNHNLHFSAFISQLRLSTRLTADFAYLTKSSIQWRLVLVEIERPDIRLFLSEPNQLAVTSEFSKRIAQIHEWKDEIRRNPEALPFSLGPLRRPLEQNAIDVRYLLIVGRSAEQFQDQRHADRLLHVAGEDVQISTFDTLLRHYLSGLAELRNILSIRKGIVHFKHLHIPPPSMFAHLHPHELSLTLPQTNKLRSWGYDIPAWQSGKLLSFNGKKPLSQFKGSGEIARGKPVG